MFVSLLVAKLASAAVADDLSNFCPKGYDTWSEVPQNDWYWGNDWEELIANGTNPPGKSGVFPVGFRRYELAWYNEPPICMLVPNSHDKKVEVLVYSDLENANLCIHDASDLGVAQNDVGDVNTCGSGQIYACFTAATTDDGTTKDDFGFYVSCQDGCEQMETTVHIRVRLSNQDWDAGKTGVDDDLEMWCENEKGTLIDPNDPLGPSGHKYYTWPNELVPDEPLTRPFEIKHLLGGSAGNFHTVSRFNFLLPLLSVFCLACLLA